MGTARIFKDSVKPSLIPVTGCDGVLAYCNGAYAWKPSDEQRFRAAGKQIRHIDVIGNAWQKAAILDVERGDATPETAREWIPQRNAHYRNDATVYIQRSSMDDLFAVCGGLGYWLIIADWTGAPHNLSYLPLPDGVRIAGVQYNTIPDVYDVTAIYAPDWYPVPHQAAKGTR